ncbi:unnamed protein product, partial [Iphiclides podalirius]
MKKVVLICLLSLSLCLGKPADEQVPAKSQQQNDTAIDPKITISTETSQVSSIATTTEQKAVPKTISNDTPSTETTPSPNETKINGTQPTSDENKTKKDMEPQKKEEKKVEPPKETNSTTEVKPITDNKEISNNTSKPEETTKPEKKEEKGIVITTEKSGTTVKPTESPKKEDDKPVLQARGFDGPSFIGGIILTLGLLAISFMGFKYYKNQTERNYHTL